MISLFSIRAPFFSAPEFLSIHLCRVIVAIFNNNNDDDVTERFSIIVSFPLLVFFFFFLARFESRYAKMVIISMPIYERSCGEFLSKIRIFNPGKIEDVPLRRYILYRIPYLVYNAVGLILSMDHWGTAWNAWSISARNYWLGLPNALCDLG